MRSKGGDQRTRNQNTVERSLPRRVTGRLKLACDLMIWGGANGLALDWDAAARQVGLRTRTMRVAIQKPHVRTYLNEQRRALLVCASAQNISRAVAIRDQDANRMAALGAIKLLEGGADPRTDNGPVTTPGVCIQIVDL